ncbi:hypothetical protein Tco_0839167 [Tanacetum coccineum]|uniref:Uncharacterized protein n=1 Tax=Tanacetum coccineum TaxID=301880 RepID=A0ABQ5APW4_9ASTR
MGLGEDNLAELFSPDLRPRPFGKPRHAKKAESVDTCRSHVRGEEKELGFLDCRELEFLMIGPESLPPQKAAYI